VGLLAAVFIIRKKRPRKWEIVFLAMWAVTLLANWNRTLETYDAKQLQHELQTATSASDVQRVISQSKTHFGKLLTAVMAIESEARADTERVFASLNDPALSEVLNRSSMSDPQKLKQALSIAVRDAQIAAQASDKIQAIARRERENILAAVKSQGVSEDATNNVTTGVDERHSKLLPLYLEYVAVEKDALQNIIAALELLLSEQGRYSVRPNGTVLFADARASEKYDDNSAALRAVIAREDDVTARLRTAAEQIQRTSIAGMKGQ
jgi:hypothetical protein